MIASFVIGLREGIEAALIVGIILGYLRKIGASGLMRPVHYGVVLGIAASLAVAGAFALLAFEFEGAAEQVFEGTTMLLAAAILTTMILWMRENSKTYSDALKEKVQLALTRQQSYGLATLAFVSIFREGVETVLFMGSSSFSSDGLEILVGGLLGIGLAVMIGIAIMRYSVRLDLRTFFSVTGVLLIFFAAGLVAHGIHEFEEAGLVAPVVEHVWDSNWIVDEDSALGEILTALFGYNGDPSLVEVFGYLSYWALALFWMFRDVTLTIFRKAFASIRPS